MSKAKLRDHLRFYFSSHRKKLQVRDWDLAYVFDESMLANDMRLVVDDKIAMIREQLAPEARLKNLIYACQTETSTFNDVIFHSLFLFLLTIIAPIVSP